MSDETADEAYRRGRRDAFWRAAELVHAWILGNLGYGIPKWVEVALRHADVAYPEASEPLSGSPPSPRERVAP